MIERQIAERFLHKSVGVVRVDNDKQVFSRGKITEVTETCIILEFQGTQQAISLSVLENIRETEPSNRREFE